MPSRPVSDRSWGFPKALPENSDIFIPGKYAKKLIFLNFAVFSTLPDDCDGDFDLEFEFHNEDQPKYKR